MEVLVEVKGIGDTFGVSHSIPDPTVHPPNSRKFAFLFSVWGRKEKGTANPQVLSIPPLLGTYIETDLTRLGGWGGGRDPNMAVTISLRKTRCTSHGAQLRHAEF